MSFFVNKTTKKLVWIYMELWGLRKYMCSTGLVVSGEKQEA
jgi:hypothetical protein